jgi:hypothetical protein
MTNTVGSYDSHLQSWLCQMGRDLIVSLAKDERDMIQIEGSSYPLRQLADLVRETSSRNQSSRRRRRQTVAAVQEGNNKKRKALTTGSPLTVCMEKSNARKYANFGAL